MACAAKLIRGRWPIQIDTAVPLVHCCVLLLRCHGLHFQHQQREHHVIQCAFAPLRAWKRINHLVFVGPPKTQNSLCLSANGATLLLWVAVSTTADRVQPPARPNTRTRDHSFS